MSIFSFVQFEYFLRIVLAVICGFFIGLEREKRLKNAGIRTHIIVALAASLMMIVSKYGFMDVVGIDGLRLQVDPSRIAAGVVTAIGFLSVGVIFTRRESAVGITTAAGLWATVGIGIAIGSGLYLCGILSTLLILFVQALLHIKKFRLITQVSGIVKVNLNDKSITVDGLREYFRKEGISVKHITLSRQSGANELSIYVSFPKHETPFDIIERISDSPYIDVIDIHTIS